MDASFARLVVADRPEWRALLGSPTAAESEPLPPVEGGYEARPRVSLHVQRGGDVHIRWRRQRMNGPVRHALTTGRTVFIADVQTDTEFGPHHWWQSPDVHTFIVAPLVLMGESLGALCVAYHAVAHQDEWSRRALESFAAHAAAAVDRVSQLHHERRRASQAERMAATLASVGAANTMEEGLEALVRGAIDLLGGVCGTARVRDPESGDRLISVNVERDGAVTVRRPAGAPRPGSYAASLEAGGPAVLVEDYWALGERDYP